MLVAVAVEHTLQLQLYLLLAVQAVLVEVVEAVEADQILLQDWPVMQTLVEAEALVKLVVQVS
jgi:hypothetical protein